MYDLFIRTDRHIQEKTTFLAALLCISAYRLSVGSFQVFTHVYPQSRYDKIPRFLLVKQPPSGSTPLTLKVK